ncbi:DNA polymerase III subunit tau [Dorea longicatena]|nr:DNA polymerase III subunit tau [Dorea longicatena]
MSYTALYRKFRPTTFEDVKGQDHIIKTLQNQIKADRLVEQERRLWQRYLPRR